MYHSISSGMGAAGVDPRLSGSSSKHFYELFSSAQISRFIIVCGFLIFISVVNVIMIHWANA